MKLLCCGKAEDTEEFYAVKMAECLRDGDKIYRKPNPLLASLKRVETIKSPNLYTTNSEEVFTFPEKETTPSIGRDSHLSEVDLGSRSSLLEAVRLSDWSGLETGFVLTKATSPVFLDGKYSSPNSAALDTPQKYPDCPLDLPLSLPPKLDDSPTKEPESSKVSTVSSQHTAGSSSSYRSLSPKLDDSPTKEPESSKVSTGSLSPLKCSDEKQADVSVSSQHTAGSSSSYQSLKQHSFKKLIESAESFVSSVNIKSGGICDSSPSVRSSINHADMSNDQISSKSYSALKNLTNFEDKNWPRKKSCSEVDLSVNVSIFSAGSKHSSLPPTPLSSKASYSPVMKVRKAGAPWRNSTKE